MPLWVPVLFQLTARSAIASILILALLTVGFAQVRSSSNYQIQSDSINVGGGYSTSSSYIQESTVGEIATGPSDSSTYQLRAGYQQMQESSISLSVVGDVVMSPSIDGLTGGESNGSTSVIVTTDNPAGYSLSLRTENEPAMQSAVGTIADYAPAGVPDFNFNYDPAEAVFGFSPEGTDIVQAYLDNTTDSCNEPGGSDTSLRCWDGLATTSTDIASASGSNHPNGVTTTVQFRVGVGSSAGVTAGEYVATSTFTAITL